jgi:hypothetical protein
VEHRFVAAFQSPSASGVYANGSGDPIDAGDARDVREPYWRCTRARVVGAEAEMGVWREWLRPIPRRFPSSSRGTRGPSK